MGTAGGPARRRLPIGARSFTPSAFQAPPATGSSLDKALDTPDLAAAGAWRELEFRTDINGLRAVAVLGVVAFHADRALVPGGFAGVDVFFVISGFLISRIILSECAVGHFSLPAFYAKRAKRILPALLVVVSAVWVVGWFRAAPVQFRDIGGRPARQFIFHRELLAHAARRSRGIFRRGFRRQAPAPSLVAEHRGAVLSRLVGSAVGGVQAEWPAAAVRHSRHISRLVRLLRRSDPDQSDRRLLSAVDAGLGTRARRAPRLARGVPAPPMALSIAQARRNRRRARALRSLSAAISS